MNKILFVAMIFASFLGAAFADDAATLLARKTPASKNYVDTVVATKQPVLEQQSGDYAVIYPTTTDGVVGARPIVTSVSGTAIGLVTAGAVNSALNKKQDKITGTSGNIVTYNDELGATGSKPVYNTSKAYNNQTNALVEAEHVNTAVTNGFNAHLQCQEYLVPNDTTSGCLLYKINILAGTYMP